MTRSLRSSDHDALALICAIAQTRDARITSAALSNHHPVAGAQLQASGVLTRVGDEAAATSLADHEDTPVALARSPDGRSFGYFSPQAGWVTASPDAQAVYALSFENSSAKAPRSNSTARWSRGRWSCCPVCSGKSEAPVCRGARPVCLSGSVAAFQTRRHGPCFFSRSSSVHLRDCASCYR